MHTIDYFLFAIYPVLLLGLGAYNKLRSDSTVGELILGGRRLTLPAFVASLVSTYYGGILTVGEYTYSNGISNWLVFGFPYYIAAGLFAIFLAKKARESELVTIPQRLSQVYDERTALVGSVIIFLLSVPAAYVLMLGVMFQQLFTWPLWVGVLVGMIFSIAYLFQGGFNAVIRTDIFQFGLMFTGFAMLLTVLISKFGFIDFLQSNLPDSHLTWHGGKEGWYIASWYVIALSTLIEPAFFQRCYAAKSPRTARNGIIVSIGFWMIFDFMTTSCGLYARILLPDLADPIASFPALAQLTLPPGFLGLFALGLAATVMSTVDSYSFLAATTFGHDIIPRIMKSTRDRVSYFTNVGLVLSTILAVSTALFFRSAVDIWHAFGSIGTPSLLVPLFSSFVGNRRMPASACFACMISSGLVAMLWYFTKLFDAEGNFWLSVQPIFPGLITSLVFYFLTARKIAE